MIVYDLFGRHLKPVV